MRLMIYSIIIFPLHPRYKIHEKQTKGSPWSDKGSIREPVASPSKKKYSVIKHLLAEADRFIFGATLGQQLCIYLPCTHAGCANFVFTQEKAKGIITAKIIVYWFGTWSESVGRCRGTPSAWWRLCQRVISVVLFTDVPIGQPGCYL